MPKNISSEKIKAKYQSLKLQYSAIRKMEDETGNSSGSDAGDRDEEGGIKYPSYWDIMVNYLGDKKGLSNVEYGESERSRMVQR